MRITERKGWESRRLWNTNTQDPLAFHHENERTQSFMIKREADIKEKR